MYRKIEDFIIEWDVAAAGTLRVLEAMTDEKLNQAIVEGHSTLGWLGWHLATAPAFFGGLVGLTLQSGNPKDVPTSANSIVEAYRQIAEDVKTEASKLSEAELVAEIDSFKGKTTRGALLRALIDHQTHHRGQMTVLLRQAGLEVPGVMGPTKEESN
ncbi:DinB family protein [Gracilibacillus marinus]|jgi:uncharacterized damage-inducible protein DinB|uniref:DinB family protein n=1 Tax=Gracilibacillus marinus TaxID=630535 RepID=A0ABV8VSU0_9BACI